jgi:predicted ATPase
MRITRIEVSDLPPIRAFEITDLSGPVIIAGANGSGKTRLMDALAATFRSPSSPQLSVTVEATRRTESDAWAGDRLEVKRGTNCVPLSNYMNSRLRGGTHVGTVVQIDSARSVTQVKFQPITLATPDPYDAEIQLTYFLSPFANRWPDLVNKIYQKAAARDLKIAASARSNPEATGQSYLDANPDPFTPYRDVFAQLLPGKSLEPIDPKQPREFHYRIGAAGPLAFQSLSSGEQEVVKVAFDLIWKEIRHSVILIDEPELHLHPTLAFRLIETLKGLGGGTNQLILFTHSTDLISTYYATGNVYFIDIGATSENQGRRLSDLHRGHVETARAVGANLGLFAVGKKLVFVEGTEASVDRLTYHKVAQQCFPDAYLLPMGSVKNINALHAVSEELSRAIFGVDLFMIRDRDGLTDEQVAALEANPRFRVLPRRHVENFFLDAEVLAKVAEHFYLPDGKADPAGIETALKAAATSCFNLAALSEVKLLVHVGGTIDAPTVKNVDTLEAEALESILIAQLTAAVAALSSRMSESSIKNVVKATRQRLSAALQDTAWKNVFPGKAVLARFVGSHWGLDLPRVRQAYVDIALKEKPVVLQPIREMFEAFKSVT